MTSSDYDRDVSQTAALPLGTRLRRAFSLGINPAASIRALKSSIFAASRSSSEDSANLSPLPEHHPVGLSSELWRLSEVRVESGEEGGWETIVGPDGITPAMGRTPFHSEKHGFRLWVQPDSVPMPLSPGRRETSGPIRVRAKVDTVDFEGGELEGVLEVECLPCGRRFDAPLLLDFLVDSGNKEAPIIDSHGRIQYEILIKDPDSDSWLRDPESSIPLEIVQDNQGNVYVRAHVRHFSLYKLFKRKKLSIAPQQFHKETIPWAQRERHQSVIQNNTPEGVDIHIYAMRMSQWSAALQSVKAGAGVEGFQANFEFNGDIHENVNPATLVPQMVTIPPRHSHWIEVPRVGAGFRSSRKAVVMIVTESHDENDGTRRRLEAAVHLRSDTMLTVTLPVKDGKVTGSPPAPGGILSQLMRLIENSLNATPNNAPSTAARSRSEANSGANFGGLDADQFVGSPAMAESSDDDGSPTGAGPEDDAAAVTTPTAIAAEAAAAAVSVATVPEAREPPAAKNAINDATAGARARVQPNASPCSPAMSAVGVSPVA
ncbi:unnamed protein product [Ectocarpus fasciculatus]